MPSLRSILKFGTNLFGALSANSQVLHYAEPPAADLASSNYQQSVAAVYWGPNRLYAFAIGAQDRALYYQYWNEPGSISNGSGWTNLHGRIASPPVVIAPESGNLHVFVLSSDWGIRVKYNDGNRWVPNDQDWIPLGAYYFSPPAVASGATEGIDLVARSPGNDFWHASTRDGYDHLSWESLGGDFTSQPSVVAWGPNRLDVVGRGQEGDFLWKYWNGTTWSSEWVSLGGDFASSPTLVSKQANRLSLYGIDRNGNLQHQWWDGRKWGRWENLGGSLNTAIALQQSPASDGLKQRYDIFAVNKQGVLLRSVWTGSKTLPWEELGKTIISAPAVASWTQNHLDVFGLNSVKALVHQAWDGKTWSPSISEANNLGGDFINFDELPPRLRPASSSRVPLLEL